MKKHPQFNEEVYDLIKENKLDEKMVEQVLENELKKSKKKKCILFIFLFTLFIVLLVFLLCTPVIHLKGKKEQTLEYSKQYQEKGFTASLFDQNKTNEVVVKGKVNSKKLGHYTITYTVKNGIFTKEVKRIVSVVDTEKPVITLKGSEKTDVCPNTNYIEEGYEVKDNYDGNLTKKIKIETEKNQILYSIKDSSQNEAKIKRQLIYQDIQKPVITLKGEQTVHVVQGSSYIEPGYDVIDNCDNDISTKVTVDGTVNENILGTYTITYRAKDKAGNEETVQRTVIINSRRSGSGEAGVIYLTFDDGPQAGTTSQILDVLKEEGVKATFFVTSGGPDSLIKREYDEGHTLALHTSTHNYAKVYASSTSYFSDLKAVSDRVARITGITSSFIRFPGGSSNLVSKHYTPGIMTYLTKEVVNRGYRYYDWNVDSEGAGRCAGATSSTCEYNYMVAGLSKRRINMVLLHDVKHHTAESVRSLIRYGKQNGYTFKAITKNTPMVTHGLNN